jgi:hypothetical protein
MQTIALLPRSTAMPSLSRRERTRVRGGFSLCESSRPLRVFSRCPNPSTQITIGTTNHEVIKTHSGNILVATAGEESTLFITTQPRTHFKVDQGKSRSRPFLPGPLSHSSRWRFESLPQIFFRRKRSQKVPKGPKRSHHLGWDFFSGLRTSQNLPKPPIASL